MSRRKKQENKKKNKSFGNSVEFEEKERRSIMTLVNLGWKGVRQTKKDGSSRAAHHWATKEPNCVFLNPPD